MNATAANAWRPPAPPQPARADRRGQWLVALAVVALHLAVAGRYGYFRDELYYIAASRHPALGYFDFPAGIALLTWAILHTLGASLLALHLPPALAHAGLVLIAAEIAGELGGGRRARLLAALATGVAPAFLGSASILTMDVFDELCWALAAWAAVRALRRDAPRIWLLFGCAAAAGLLFKMTMLFFGGALLVGLALSATGRRHLASRWPWLGGAIAALGILPYALWEMRSGWPTLAFYAHYRLQQASGGPSVAAFIEEQLLLTSLTAVPVWVAGLWFLLRDPRGRALRPLGYAYVLLLVAFAAAHAKVYFLTPLYTALFGVGAPVVEAWMARGARGWTAWAYPLALIAGAATLAPIVMPLLPPAGAAAYSAPLHVGEYTSTGSNPIIQPMADRFGWPQQVAAVAAAFDSLPAGQRTQACVIAANYGEAGAVDFFGPALGLPAAISGHNQYFLWGPRGCTFAVAVSVGLPTDFLSTLFAQVQPVERVACQYCVPGENGVIVAIDMAARQSPARTWADLRSVG